MSKHRKTEEEEEGKNERWLITYSDMMTLLLVLFIVLFNMSSLDLTKYKTIMYQLGLSFNAVAQDVDPSLINGNLSGAPSGSVSPGVSSTAINPGQTASPDGSGGIPGSIGTDYFNKDQFAKTYEALIGEIKSNGYESIINIEKGDYYINLQFKDGILFYPNSAKMKAEGSSSLDFICDALYKIDSSIAHIEIKGHTAEVGNNTGSYFSWELSSDRALAVLKYLVEKGHLQQNKMSISGYSHYDSVSENNTEEGRALNRRVEIIITAMPDTQ